MEALEPTEDESGVLNPEDQRARLLIQKLNAHGVYLSTPPGKELEEAVEHALDDSLQNEPLTNS